MNLGSLTCNLYLFYRLSESDGKNHAQLFDWANLHDYVDFLIIHRAHIRSPLAWYQDGTIDALVVWIMWMTTSRGQNPRSKHTNLLILAHSERIRSEPLDHRNLVFNVLRAFIIIGFRVSYAGRNTYSGWQTYRIF